MEAIHILQKNVDIMRFVGYNNQGRADARFVKVRAGTQSPAASTLEVILRPNSFNKVSTLNTEGATQYGTLG